MSHESEWEASETAESWRHDEWMEEKERHEMTELTTDQARELSGTHLDRAVDDYLPDMVKAYDNSEACESLMPMWHSDERLLPLAFAEGGPLEPTETVEYNIRLTHKGIDLVRHDYRGDDVIAFGPDIQHAVWRAVCVVSLEAQEEHRLPSAEADDHSNHGLM